MGVMADLAGNAVLSLVLQSVGYIVTEQVLTTIERGELEKRIVHDHREMAEAIIAGDEVKAEALAREHLRHIVEDFRAYWPLKVGEKVQWR